VPTFPVYVVADDPVGRYVEIAVDESLRFLPGQTSTPDTRAYAERLTKLRLHQPVFRARVLQGVRAGVRHLPAQARRPARRSAHPVRRRGRAAGDPERPVAVQDPPRGYDRGILGRPAGLRRAGTPRRVLEVDGPMLKHGIQDVQGWHLELPKRISERPDRDLLAQRYEAFSR
jgi:putative restriction endonuclease